MKYPAATSWQLRDATALAAHHTLPIDRQAHLVATIRRELPRLGTKRREDTPAAERVGEVRCGSRYPPQVPLQPAVPSFPCERLEQRELWQGLGQESRFEQALRIFVRRRRIIDNATPNP